MVSLRTKTHPCRSYFGMQIRIDTLTATIRRLPAPEHAGGNAVQGEREQ